MTRREREEAKKEQKELSRKGAAKLAKLLEFPETAIAGTALLQIAGNREATIDGSQGVLEYNEECIRINAGKMMLKFSGRGLSLKCLSGETLVIEGFITQIEFLT